MQHIGYEYKSDITSFTREDIFFGRYISEHVFLSETKMTSQLHTPFTLSWLFFFFFLANIPWRNKLFIQLLLTLNIAISFLYVGVISGRNIADVQRTAAIGLHFQDLSCHCRKLYSCMLISWLATMHIFILEFWTT